MIFASEEKLGNWKISQVEVFTFGFDHPWFYLFCCGVDCLLLAPGNVAIRKKCILHSAVATFKDAASRWVSIVSRPCNHNSEFRSTTWLAPDGTAHIFIKKTLAAYLRNTKQKMFRKISKQINKMAHHRPRHCRIDGKRLRWEFFPDGCAGSQPAANRSTQRFTR